MMVSRKFSNFSTNIFDYLYFAMKLISILSALSITNVNK